MPEATESALAVECETLRRRVAELEAERQGGLERQQQQLEALTAALRVNKSIIQSAHEGIIVYGPDLRYRVWNPCMERLTGRKADDVLGKLPMEVFPFLDGVGVAARLRQALAGEVPSPVEFQFNLCGTPSWCVDTSAPLRDETGKVIGVIATVQDVTERRRQERELQRSAERWSLALKSGELAVWDWNVRTNEMVWDDEMLRLYGLTRASFPGGVEAWTRGLHPEDRERAVTESEAALEGGRDFDTEFRVLRPNGEVRHVKADGLVLRDETGAAVRMLGVNRDITERKQGDEERRQAHEDLARQATELRALFEASRAVLERPTFPEAARALFDIARRAIGAQSGYVALLSPGGDENVVLHLEAGGLPCTVDPQLPMPIRGLRERAYRTSHAVFENAFTDSEWAAFMPQGHVRLRNVLFAPLNAGTRTVGIIGLANKPSDFDEADAQLATAFGNLAALALQNERSTAAVRSSEEQYRALVHHLPVGIVVHAPDSSVVLANAEASRILGLSLEQLLGKVAGDPVWKIVREDGSPLPEDEFPATQALASRKPTGTLALGVDRLPTGERSWVLAHAFPELDDQQQVRQVVVTFLDVSERRRTEEALRASGQSLRQAQRIAQVGSWEWGIATDTVTWSEELFRIKGLDPSTGAPSWADHSRYYAAESFARLEAAVRRAQESGEPYELEVDSVLPDGRMRRGIARGEVVRDQGGRVTGLRGTLQDVQDRRDMEEQLLQAQKMEAIGTLAGGVAHDFNNILGGVLSGLSLVEYGLGDSDDGVRADLEEVKDLVRRGADLARQLLGFGRRGKYSVQPLDLGAVVQKTCAMFGRTRRDLVITHDFAPGLQAVLMDHTQLEQVVLNLLLNAGQAMPAGGRILLRADHATVTTEQAEVHGTAPGTFVRLVVVDTGVGMDAATKARVFEPFFTTRQPGQGTGLGLASVYGIMKNHGGIVTVESEPGRGAAFTLLLPATSGPPREKAVSPVPPRAVGRGTILVVDDDERLLRLNVRLLHSMGYEALSAPGGREAIELVREHRGRLSLVILDLTMPEMSGASTFEAIRKISPEVKVLLSSGFSVDGQAQQLLDRGCNGFIQKPFDVATLSEKIRSLQ